MLPATGRSILGLRVGSLLLIIVLVPVPSVAAAPPAPADVAATAPAVDTGSAAAEPPNAVDADATDAGDVTPATTSPESERPRAQEAGPTQPASPAKPESKAESKASTKEDKGEHTEEIVVTGSRIRMSPTEKQTPVLSVTADDIERAGITSIADLLQMLPMSGGGLNSRFNQSGNSGFPPDGSGVGAGAAQADLRYLGPKRVLVLVDGVRWVNGSAASGVPAATDLNTIPMGIVDHIEVLQDGASPIYGSDAISGVINIITKKEFQGVAANAYAGAFTAGDGATQNYDITWGNKTDQMNLVLNVSFADQGSVMASERDISRWPTPGVNGCTGRCSSGTPEGRVVFTDPNTGKTVDLALNPGTAVPYYDPSNPGGGSDTYHQFGDADRFNFQPYNYVLTPSRRYGIFGRADYKLFEHATLFAKAVYNNRKSRNQAAPVPIFIGPEAGNGNRLDRISVDATNPYNPFGFTLDDSTDYVATRRPLEAGPRIFTQNVDTFYAAGGLHGDVPTSTAPFYWDATAVYARNRADQVMFGNINSARLQKALGPLAECEAEPGCVPFNMFGGQGADGKGTITREMLDYVSFNQHDLSQQELWDFSANVTGELFELPGGALSLAAGAEYRKQSGFFQPDAAVVAGETSDVQATPTSGSIDVKEAYAEIVVPLVSDLPAADLLDVSAAARVSKYSTFAAEDTYKLGMRYRPTPDLLFRGLFVQGFRAPGIGELYGSAARFDQVLTDPCSDYVGRTNGTPASPDIQEHCRALGVPEDYQQLNSQVSVTTGGSRQLKPETSKTYGAGFVYSPSWLEHTPLSERVSLEVSYYWIRLTRTIQAVNAQVQLDLCVRTLDPALCSGISRTDRGHINGFGNTLTNIGGTTTSGFDITLSYLSPETAMGRLRFTVLANLLSQYEEKIPSSTGFDTLSRRGTEQGDPPQAYPKIKSTVTADWSTREWRASWAVRYVGSVVEPCRDLEDYPGLCSRPNQEDPSLSKNELKAVFYSDVQAGYAPAALDSRLSVTLGVNNLFNQSPPRCYSCALNGFDPTTYDVPGVFGYLRAGVRL